MDCSTARERLPFLIDAELPPEDARAVEEHLSACAACAATRRGHESADALVRAAAVPFPDSGEWARIVERARVPEPVVPTAFAFGECLRWRALAAAAVVAALLPVAAFLALSPSPAICACAPEHRHEDCVCDVVGMGLDTGL